MHISLFYSPETAVRKESTSWSCQSSSEQRTLPLLLWDPKPCPVLCGLQNTSVWRGRVFYSPWGKTGQGWQHCSDICAANIALSAHYRKFGAHWIYLLIVGICIVIGAENWRCKVLALTGPQCQQKTQKYQPCRPPTTNQTCAFIFQRSAVQKSDQKIIFWERRNRLAHKISSTLFLCE